MRKPRAAAPPGVLVIHETEPASYGWATVKNSQHQHHVRHRPRRTRRPSIRRSKAGSSATSRRRCFAASGLNFEAAKAAANAQGFPAGPAQGDARPPTSTPRPRRSPRTTSSASCRGKQLSRRDGDLHRALGPSRHRQARRQRRRDLQRRGRQRHRPRPADRAGPRLRARARARALGRLPGRHRRGEGPAGQRILCRQSALPARQDGRACSTPTSLGVLGPARNFIDPRHARVRPARRPDRGRRQAQGRCFTPDPQPETGGFFRSDHFTFAKVGVPAISFKSGEDLVNGGVAARRSAGRGLHRQALSPARRRMVADAGTSPAWPRMRAAPRASACASPIRANGRTGATTANSAPSATAARPNASRRRAGERGERRVAARRG